MALVFKDRVKVTSTTAGTGTFTLGSADTGFQSFSAIGDGNTTYYTITDSSGNWEVGLGTYTSSGTTLSRDLILESSNSGSVVDFPAGTKTVFVTYPAEKSVAINSSGNLTVTVNAASGGTGLTSPGASGNVLTSNGTEWTSSAPSGSKGVDVQTFNSSGTWTKPSGYGTSSRVLIQVWGGGGSGGKHTYAGGGGGGGYNETWLFLSQLGATETITIGSGGAGKTTQSAGNAGGTSSVGSLISAYGGGAGNATSGVGPLGGGGGGQLSAGRNGGGNSPSVANGWGGSPQILTTGMLGQTGTPNPYFGTTSELNFLPQGTANLGRSIACAGTTITYPANQHGGGGGTDTNTGTNDVYRGGDSIWGGGGGGAGNATYGAGGTSKFGGAGGAGKDTTDGVAGTQPAGGGGATNTGSTSGAGGDGKVIITVFYGA